MADTPEKRVKRAVEAMLKNMGVYYFFPPANGYGRSGIPDIICCVNGSFLAIECKAGGNKPTPLQIREIENIRLAGGVAIVANEGNWDMVRSLVCELKGAA
jgi:Holliday junction resolvase